VRLRFGKVEIFFLAPVSLAHCWRPGPSFLVCGRGIERSGKAQGRLIDDLLDTARVISGKLRLELGPVDLVSVIEQAVQTIHPAADSKGISIETDLPSEIGQITSDSTRLRQVVWNLIFNAVKFTPQGGRVGRSDRR
jgi:signal transduction histidine kinase